ALPNRPTAIFAANDLSAITTLEVAKATGLRIPEDLSVVGFANIPEAALADPRLTPRHQSIQDLGQEAARLLVALIETPDRAQPVHVTLPTRLIARQSCAAPSD